MSLDSRKLNLFKYNRHPLPSRTKPCRKFAYKVAAGHYLVVTFLSICACIALWRDSENGKTISMIKRCELC